MSIQSCRHQTIFQDLERFRFGPSAKADWAQEIHRRANGLYFPFHDNFYHRINPLCNPWESMLYTWERYRAAFDYLQDVKVNNLIEIGCAHGISTFLLRQCAQRTIGVDISAPMIELAGTLFPECEFHACSYDSFLENFPLTSDDVIVSCAGPTGKADEAFMESLPAKWIYIAYRTRTFKQFFTQCHKLKGRQLNFEATVINDVGISKNYMKYYFTPRYVKHLKHSLLGKYLPQL